MKDTKIEQMNHQRIHPSYTYRAHKHDVFCGRGKNTYCHPGNQFYQKLVKAVRVECIASSRLEKVKCAQYVVDTIMSLSPPGKFLAFSNKDKTYYEIGDQKAVEKTRQALREGAPAIRKGIKDGRCQVRRKTRNHMKTLVSDEARKLYGEQFLSCSSTSMAAHDYDCKPIQIHGPGKDYQEVQEGAVPSSSVCSPDMVGMITNPFVHSNNIDYPGLPRSISFTTGYIEKYIKIQCSPPGQCHLSSLGYSQFIYEKEIFLPGIPDISNTGNKHDLLGAVFMGRSGRIIITGRSARRLPKEGIVPCASLRGEEDKLPTKSAHQHTEGLPDEMVPSQGMMPMSFKEPTSCCRKLHEIRNGESISMGSFLKSSIESVGNDGMDQLSQTRISIEKVCDLQVKKMKSSVGTSKCVRALQVLLDDDSIDGNGDENEEEPLDQFASKYMVSDKTKPSRSLLPGCEGPLGMEILSESWSSSFNSSRCSGRTSMKLSRSSQMLMNVEEEVESIGTFDLSDDESLDE